MRQAVRGAAGPAGPRALRGVAHRCPCGLPDVVETAPRLADGTPVPDAVLPDLPARRGRGRHRLEAAGLMREMQQRLAAEPELRAAQQAAHGDYLARRAAAAAEAGVAPLPPARRARAACRTGSSACTRWSRTSCAVPGANPLGGEAADAAGEWWLGPCWPGACRPMNRPGVRPGTRVAAIDCGTNSLRLLVADVDPVAGQAHRRGPRGWRSSGSARASTPPAGSRRMRWTARCACWLATPASSRTVGGRGADGRHQRHPGRGQRAEFVRGVDAVLGVDAGGAQRRRGGPLSFTGHAGRRGRTGGRAGAGVGSRRRPEAWPAAPVGVRRRAIGGPAAVPGVDIGGGSTEFVLGGSPAGRPVSALSVDIGCVRLTERHLHADPPTAAEIGRGRRDIDAALDRVAGARARCGRARTLVGLAGSVTTVAGARARPARLRPGRDPPRADLRRAGRGAGRVRCSPDPRERAALAVMHPGRVDVIGAGALVLDDGRCAGSAFAEVLVSEHDILDGIAWSLAGPGPGERPGPARRQPGTARSGRPGAARYRLAG